MSDESNILLQELKIAIASAVSQVTQRLVADSKTAQQDANKTQEMLGEINKSLGLIIAHLEDVDRRSTELQSKLDGIERRIRHAK